MTTPNRQIKRRQPVPRGGSASRQFDKKLARYALAGSAFLAAPVLSRAEIVFSGVVDETTLNGGSIAVSFDNSSTTDFTLETFIYNSGGSYPTLEGYVNSYTANGALETNSPVASNTAIGTNATPNTTGLELAYDETYWNSECCDYYTYQYVCGESTFGDDEYCTGYDYYDYEAEFSSNGGAFPNGVPEYLGFEFTRSGNTFYGWAQVEANVTNTSSQVELIDYAYDNTPNTPILAGDEASPTPEPSSIVMFAIGAAGVLALRRRRSIAN